MGIFNTLQLVVNYAPIVTIGILNGLNREIPLYVGKGERDTVNKLAAVALF